MLNNCIRDLIPALKGLFIIALFLSSLVAQQATKVIVYPGDTLWSLAQKHYNNPYLVIFEANKESISDPNKLFPGTSLIIPQSKKISELAKLLPKKPQESPTVTSQVKQPRRGPLVPPPVPAPHAKLIPSPPPKTYATIAIIYSSYTKVAYEKLGMDYDEYIGYILKAFDSIELIYDVVPESLLEEEPEKLMGYKVLILPNMRCMSEKQAKNIISYTERGGKVVATYTTSFRNEKDEYVFEPRDFRLRDLFGINFVRWVSNPPKCTYIKPLDKNHPIWKNLPEYIRVFRYTSMVVNSRPDNTFAVWYDEDKTTPSFPEGENASIILTDKIVYTGEDLFAPENIHNKLVRKLLKNIIDYLHQ